MGSLRRHGGRGLVAVAALAALVLISGCTQNAPQPVPEADAVRTGVPEAELHDAVDCRSEASWLMPDAEEPATEISIPVPGRVPARFDASAAVRCSVDVDLAPVGGLGGSVVWRLERLEGDLRPLLDALAQPDDVAPDGLACAADMEIVPALWLEARAGGFVPVHYPRNACGKTKPAVWDALNGLKVTTVERITEAF